MLIKRFWSLLFAGKLADPADFKHELRRARREEDYQDAELDRFLGMIMETEHRLQEGRLYYPSEITSERTLRYHERADWSGADPRIKAFSGRLIKALARKGIPMYAHGAVRTFDEQRELVSKGVSKASPPDAPHVQGMAADIVHCVYHWNMTETEWAVIGAIGKRIAQAMGIDIVWGGDWRFYDPAHWELRDWRVEIDPAGVHKQPPTRLTPTVLARTGYPK